MSYRYFILLEHYAKLNEVETSAMLPRRPIMFLKRSDMLGKASLHWRKTCKILSWVQMLSNDIQRPPCHSCPRSAHYWLESHPSHSTWPTRLCPSPRRRILNSFSIFSALKDKTKPGPRNRRTRRICAEDQRKLGGPKSWLTQFSSLDSWGTKVPRGPNN